MYSLKKLFVFSFLLIGLGSLAADPQTSYSFVLDKAAVFQGTTFSQGSEVHLSQEGQIFKVILGQDQRLAEQTFKESFPHIWKKGTVLMYTSAFSENQMKPVPSKIYLNSDQNIFGFIIPAKCELNPSYMIMTMNGKTEFNIDNIQVQCPFEFKIKSSNIPKDKLVQIHSKKKVTEYNDKYEQVEIK
ncbi:hypothetical protein [Leptospira sp. 'Mane']|uniref:hypothetical protein n=1 Tax=Leptospira sp. 'Mane' TaxID=3387407 RepID=UPI00398B707F